MNNTMGGISITGKPLFRNRWGKLRQIAVLNSIIRSGKLELSAAATAVLFVVLNRNKNKPVKDTQPFAVVKIGHKGQKSLIELTGYSRNAISKAVKELREKKYIERIGNRKKRGEFGANEYYLLNPQTAQPLMAARNPYLKQIKAGYFTVPVCIVTETACKWSLAKFSATELRLYTVLLYLVNQHRDNEFAITAAELRKLSGLSSPTLPKAIDGLEKKGLIRLTGEVKESCTIHVCDPYTGLPLERLTGDDRDDPSNYTVVAKDRRSRRLNLNTDDPEAIEEMLRSLIPDDQPVIEQENGDLRICCPFHDDSNPSCSVSPTKNGCFKCFGCRKKGSFLDLVMQMKGITKPEAIMHIATGLGFKTEFRQPDTDAVIYSYRDEKGKLLKQVLRYPNDENGEKVIKQRQPAKGDWIWDTEGVPPTLFHMEKLADAEVVCITEGEKDACTVTELQMRGAEMRYPPREVIGMTSGGAETWDASFAKHLQGKKVVLMPDADDAGAMYAADVKASLEAEGVEYREVTFQDAGVKDVTDYMAEHTLEDLVRKIGTDWVLMPIGPPEYVDTEITF